MQFPCQISCKTYTTDPKVQEKPAQIHINKPQKFWDCVLWSNETKLELFGPIDEQYV